MHFAVPMSGAILNTINTRLDPPTVATILHHSQAKLFFVDYQYIPLALHALHHLTNNNHPHPLIIPIHDITSSSSSSSSMGPRLSHDLNYESLIQSVVVNPLSDPPYHLSDEWDSISLNYTSGTTSAPKGVVYSHRGAYLSTLTLLLQWEVQNNPIYLWTLPMFHCNGWTFTWGVAARGGTNVCIRNPTADVIYRAILDHRVTHMCCAPIVFNVLIEYHHSSCTTPNRTPLNPAPVRVLTGGAPPPASLLLKVEALGFHVTHAYGMTEATGPALVCEWQSEWDSFPGVDQAQLKTRQGVSVLTLADADVMDTESMVRVRRDGKSVGEIMLKGSSIMKGYFKNKKATSEAFKDGWFRTGDIGVVHPDGYIEVKDRKKDVIISGGENICSTEIESVLHRHPFVVEAAVVAMPHEHWGESPCAFIRVKEGMEVREEEVMLYCKNNMARYMVPKKVVFVKELPKTLKGSVKKLELRETARELVGRETKKGKVLRVLNGDDNNGINSRYESDEAVGLSRL